MPRKGPQSTEEPLTREQEKFVAAYRRLKDIYKAAAKAGIPKNVAVRTFNLIQVQEEIERQDDVVRQERARQQVEVELLTNAFLDGELIKVIRKEKGTLKKDAIQLGYIVTGRIQAGATKLLEPAGNGIATNTAPFYQAFIPVGVPAAPIVPKDSEQGSVVSGQGIDGQPRSPLASQPPAQEPAPIIPANETLQNRAQNIPVSIPVKPANAPAYRADDETIRQRVRKLTNQPIAKFTADPTPARKAGKLQIG
jgi:hypothetical protein